MIIKILDNIFYKQLVKKLLEMMDMTMPDYTGEGAGPWEE